MSHDDTTTVREHVVDVFLEGGTAPRTIGISALEFACQQPVQWAAARWILRSAAGDAEIACPRVVEISARDDEAFPVVVVHGDGRRDHLTATGVLAGVPAGGHCLIHSPRFDGAWHGHSLTVAFGCVIIVESDYDPA